MMKKNKHFKIVLLFMGLFLSNAHAAPSSNHPQIGNQFWAILKKIWQFELIHLQGAPLTVSNLIVAIVLLIIGVWLSQKMSYFIRKKLYSKLKLETGVAIAIQTITYYLLILFFTVLALNIAHIPLTLFTLIGGALAIGIGFGSQNIINNFISGLILLVERPIRVGDVIEIEGTYGRVARIGPRCTNVLTFTNVDILVPNCSLLEKNVVNWTLTDDRVRTQVNVGVTYGSPTEKVRDLIAQAVKEHEKVLKVPEPVVLFTDFGDNALHFEVHFWIRMSTVMDRRIVESDLRYKIDSLFREAQIIIAFPQRDVHLDTTKPLEIHLTKNSPINY